VDGQLLVTRRVPYLSSADAERVASVMQHHQRRLLSELTSGALDTELRALFDGKEPWARVPTPPSMPAAPPPATFPPLPVPLQPPPFVNVLKTPPSVAGPGPVAEVSGPPPLCLVLEEPKALLPFLFSRGRTRGLVVETPQRVELGTQVEVAVRFLGRPIRQFYVPGTVTAHRMAGHGTPRGDLTVTVSGADAAVALERVEEFARGNHDPTVDRQSPRVRMSLAATVKLANGRTQSGRVFNLSEGGVMLGRMPPLMEGSKVTVDFVLPDGTALSLPGTVRWFRADGEPLTGIQFTHAGDSQARIAAQVAQLLKAP
jgi:hypothetical protein